MPEKKTVTVSPITKKEFDGSVKRAKATKRTLRKKSTSPGPHGMMMVTQTSKKIPHRFKPIKESGRVKILPLRKAGTKSAEARQEGKTPKARKLTSLMRKGYRKGYRVKSSRGGSRR